ncbi:clathrin interactor EPSIN 1 [Dioscorea cayenensis subsp. rotundata]|uniref:Clathrin interactor EPSIN 1 n=1 Tax=Dioscorea cayennensis subsp. rotundata TaxID=55577 RepID=A0AB40AWL9_DIOCR|nr:clathrin interactor EPSIN 1 [Dioscorea cayenensis subsp. rotundata]
MDFMKVFDQTVRDIKREVNLKVLKVPEIEQKVLDATSNEPWGPHGSDLLEIARNSKKYTECQMIMNVLWTRLNDTGANWRHVYKALAVIEYLIANGSDRAVDDILEHSSKIASVSSFEYMEPNGKDSGINVRKKAETILGLLRDKDKIQQARTKASANRDKYVGLSSTGITYKSSASSYGGGGFESGGYGSFGNRKEGDSFRDGYKDEEYAGDGADVSRGSKGGFSKSTGSSSNGSEGYKSKKAFNHGVSAAKSLSKPSADASKSSAAELENVHDDFDDFDPRGSSTTVSAAAKANQVDLFGESLLVDLMDAPTSVSTESTTTNHAVPSETDLFADAAFVSASPQKEATQRSSPLASETDLFADAAFVSASSQTETATNSHSQGNVDLFAGQPAFPSNFDFFAASVPPSHSETNSSKPDSTNNNIFDPFAAVPLNNFEGSDPFGDFASHSDPVSKESSDKSMNNSNTLDKLSSVASSQLAPKKDTFQVKSGIWADSLSRGLIDLNITAPKKTSLADVGVVGGLDFDEKEKGPAASSYNYMGRAMGVGSSVGWTPGFSSSTMGVSGNVPAFNQQQFGNFK